MTKEGQETEDEVLDFIDELNKRATNGTELKLRRRIRRLRKDVFAGDEMDFLSAALQNVPQLMKNVKVEADVKKDDIKHVQMHKAICQWVDQTLKKYDLD